MEFCLYLHVTLHIIIQDFPFAFINGASAPDTIHDTTTRGRISTLLALDSAVILVTMAENHANVPQIRDCATFSTHLDAEVPVIPVPQGWHPLLSSMSVYCRHIIPGSNRKAVNRLDDDGDFGLRAISETRQLTQDRFPVPPPTA